MRVEVGMGSTFVLFILLDLEIQKDWIFEELEWWDFDIEWS